MGQLKSKEERILSRVAQKQFPNQFAGILHLNPGGRPRPPMNSHSIKSISSASSAGPRQKPCRARCRSRDPAPANPGLLEHVRKKPQLLVLSCPQKGAQRQFPSTAIYRHASGAWDAPPPPEPGQREVWQGPTGVVEKRSWAFLINLLCDLGKSHPLSGPQLFFCI